MKKLIVFLLAFICVCGYAIGDSPATPTDLYESYTEIEEDDWGELEIEFERKVYITMDKEPEHLNDEMILVATLVDFQPEDRYRIFWQYSVDGEEWYDVENEHKQTFSIIINETNCHYWWRVMVRMEV